MGSRDPLPRVPHGHVTPCTRPKGLRRHSGLIRYARISFPHFSACARISSSAASGVLRGARMPWASVLSNSSRPDFGHGRHLRQLRHGASRLQRSHGSNTPCGSCSSMTDTIGLATLNEIFGEASHDWPSPNSLALQPHRRSCPPSGAATRSRKRGRPALCASLSRSRREEPTTR